MLLKRGHYNQLLELFLQFEQFEFGKSRLLQLRSERDRLESISEDDIRHVIDINGTIRDNF